MGILTSGTLITGKLDINHEVLDNDFSLCSTELKSRLYKQLANNNNNSNKETPKPTSGYEHNCLTLQEEAFTYCPKHSNTKIWTLPPHALNIYPDHSQLLPFSTP